MRKLTPKTRRKPRQDKTVTRQSNRNYTIRLKKTRATRTITVTRQDTVTRQGTVTRQI
jgi:hypothetical protein